MSPHDATEPAGPLDVEAIKAAVEAAHPEPKFKDDSRGEAWTWHGINVGRAHVYEVLARLSPGAPREDERLREALRDLVEAIDTARQNYGHMDEPAGYLLDALAEARSVLIAAEPSR